MHILINNITADIAFIKIKNLNNKKKILLLSILPFQMHILINNITADIAFNIYLKMYSSYCVFLVPGNGVSSDHDGKDTHVSLRTSLHSAVRPLHFG